MPDRIDEAALALARRFADGLAAGHSQTLADCLTDDVQFARLGGAASGRDAVVNELMNGAVAQKLQWQPPQDGGRAAGASHFTVRLVGNAAPGKQGLILTLHPAGERLARVEQQRMFAAPAPSTALAMPQALKDRIDNALAQKRPMLMSYVDMNDQPVLSFRGSIRAHGDDALSIWIRNPEGRLIQSIRRNPRVAFMYRDEDSKATYQLQGRARVADDPALAEQIWLAAPKVERDHDFARIGVPVIIELDRIEGYAGLGPAGQIDRLMMERSPR